MTNQEMLENSNAASLLRQLGVFVLLKKKVCEATAKDIHGNEFVFQLIKRDSMATIFSLARYDLKTNEPCPEVVVRAFNRSHEAHALQYQSYETFVSFFSYQDDNIKILEDLLLGFLQSLVVTEVKFADEDDLL